MTEVSRGPGGYPDYQRVENYDGPVVLNRKELKVAKGVVKGLGPFDVSRYAAVKLNIECTLGVGILKLSYGTLEGGAAFIGVREIIVSAELAREAVLEIPNLGPELTVEWFGLAASNTVLVTAVPTNRQVNGTAVFPGVLLLQSVAKPKAAGEVAVAPGFIATGTVRLFVATEGLGTPNVFITVLDATGTIREISRFAGEVGKSFIVGEFYLPPSPLRLVFTNGITEQNVTIQATLQP